MEGRNFTTAVIKKGLKRCYPPLLHIVIHKVMHFLWIIRAKNPPPRLRMRHEGGNAMKLLVEPLDLVVVFFDHRFEQGLQGVFIRISFQRHDRRTR